MARIRKSSQEESGVVVERPLSTRARIAQEYDALLAEFAVGDYGKVDLSGDDRRLTVRSRLQSAARRRCMSLRFRPGPSTALIFHVQAAEPVVMVPKPKAEPKPAAPRRPAPRQQASAPERREPQPERREPQPERREPQPERRGQPGRDSAAERWGRMLPRWMREGGRANNGRPGNQGRRRPR